MPHISLSVSENEKKWMENYANLHEISLSDAIKAVFFERLEDEYDIKMVNDFESDTNAVMYSHEEAGKILGLK